MSNGILMFIATSDNLMKKQQRIATICCAGAAIDFLAPQSATLGDDNHNVVVVTNHEPPYTSKYSMAKDLLVCTRQTQTTSLKCRLQFLYSSTLALATLSVFVPRMLRNRRIPSRTVGRVVADENFTAVVVTHRLKQHATLFQLFLQ